MTDLSPVTSSSADAALFDSMLRINDEQFVAAGKRALDALPRIEEVADSLHDRGFSTLYFIGSGGTWANTFQFEEFVRRNSNLDVRVLEAAEAVESVDLGLKSNAVAVFTSVTGDTDDVNRAIAYCKERGVLTIGFVAAAGSPIATSVDIHVASEAEWRGWEIYLLPFVARLLHRRGHFDGYAALVESLRAIPDVLLDASKQVEARAKQFAAEHATTDFTFVIGGGNLWGNAYIYSMCVLEEMLWMRTSRVSSAEFFHGAIELIEPHTTVLILQGEDWARPLTERVTRFAQKYSDDVFVLDSRDYALKGIDEEFRPLVAPMVLGVLTRRVTLHLQRSRDHNLDLRRYYRVVEY